MYKLSLSFLCMLSLSSYTMESLLSNVTQIGTYPPCDCSDQTSSLIALSIAAGSLITCYTINRCLARRKTPAQIRREEINNLRTQLEAAQGRQNLQGLKVARLQATLNDLLDISSDDGHQGDSSEPLLPAVRQRALTSIDLSVQSTADNP